MRLNMEGVPLEKGMSSRERSISSELLIDQFAGTLAVYVGLNGGSIHTAGVTSATQEKHRGDLRLVCESKIEITRTS